MNVVDFPGVKSPNTNVKNFIRFCRKQIVGLCDDEHWDNDIWPVGDHFKAKGQNRDNTRLVFYTRETIISAHREITGEPLHPAFKDFAKAYCQYKHAGSPVAFENQNKRLNALQFLESAFRSLGLVPDITRCTIAVMVKAIDLARVGVGPARHYQFGIYIKQVHDFCATMGFYDAPFFWKHGIRKPIGKTEALGADAKAWREEKLPSPEAFYGLAEVYRHAETFADKLFSSLCPIAMAIPIRANELLSLPLDCEVSISKVDKKTGESRESYGIRVFTSKGNKPRTAWVSTKMVSIVKDAVRRLRFLCNEARTIAAWYEANPKSLWLPPDLEYARNTDWLAIEDVQRLVGINSLGGLAYWIRKENIVWRSDKVRKDYMKEVRLSSLAERLLPKLPKGFPAVNGNKHQKYSALLVVIRLNEMHAQRGTYTSVVAQATVQMFEHWLSGHDGGKKASVFEAWGLREKDGSKIEITTHAFRHWLTTVATIKGMSQLDIATWSGRSVEQNKAYNHSSPEENLAIIRNALQDGGGIGPLFEAGKDLKINSPVNRRDFLGAQIGAGHVTDNGLCIHDFSMLPCPILGECWKCSENIFIKGDQKHHASTHDQLEFTKVQLARALEAMEDNYDGADRWVENHRESIERLEKMLAIHDDDSIADGTPVSLGSISNDNPIAMAMRDREGAQHGSRRPKTLPATGANEAPRGDFRDDEDE